MTIEEMADRLKKNELSEDEKYIKSLLEEQQAAERDILYLLLLFWSDKRNKRKLYKEINSIVSDLFDTIEEDLTTELAKRHQEGYAEGAFLAQLILGKFSDIANTSKFNPNWHFNKGSFLDDLHYYKNRLLDDIGKELERMIALKAPVESAVGGIKRPFKKLANSTKAMVDTEMVYAERQGLKEAYKDYEADKYRYLATLDQLTCERCSELDGKVLPLSDAKAGSNYPPMHPHCRCTVIPVFSDFDKNGRTAKDEKGENIEVNMTYDEWKKTYVTPKQIPNRLENENHEIRTKEQIKTAADRIHNQLESIVKRKSAWNGEVVVLGANDVSKALPDGKIYIVENASDVTIVHELLHTRSYLPIGYQSFLDNRPIEEGSVELFAREIAKRDGFPLNEARNDVKALLEINNRAKLYETDYEFAYELFHVELPDRLGWLSRKISSAPISANDENILFDILSEYFM